MRLDKYTVMFIPEGEAGTHSYLKKYIFINHNMYPNYYSLRVRDHDLLCSQNI